MRISELIIASLAVLVISTTTRADDESTRIKGASFKAGDPVLIEKELASSKINDSPEWSRNVSTITTLARKREQKGGPSKISETNNFTTTMNRKMGQGENQNSQNTTTRDLDFASSVGMIRKISEERAAIKRQGKEDDAEEEEKEEEERGVGENNDEDLGEAMPEAQELRAPRPGSHGRPLYRLNTSRRPPNSNRRHVFPVEAPLRSSKRPNRKPQEVKDLRTPPTENDCTFFTKTLCLETINYPHEAIMRSIRGNKEMVSALLTDYNPQNGNDDLPKALPLENHFDNRYESKYENNEIKRRSDYPSPYENVEEGFTCPSQVMYARPQLARAVSGVWKYIINTGEHTQTLRLEKCSKPKAACSFISENYRSSCVQVYNYHRLLTWDSSLGLHMDIFKVPSCCSCHVHGYAELYPPIQKDPQSPSEERFPGADFATEQIEDDTFKRPSSYLTKIRPSSLDNNYVSSGGGGGGSKPILDAGSSHRPSYTLPGRTRQKKPSSSSGITKPFDKLPQQHAPNTRAPGYKGPIIKGINRPIRTNRPYRRQSTAEIEETSPASVNKWFNQPYDQDTEASSKLHNGGFDEEYQEPNRRVNYNYHPIIDFFKPEASMLQAQEPLSTQRSASALDSSENSWKPMISP